MGFSSQLWEGWLGVTEVMLPRGLLLMSTVNPVGSLRPSRNQFGQLPFSSVPSLVCGEGWECNPPCAWGNGFGEGAKPAQGHPRVTARQMQSLRFPWGQSVHWGTALGEQIAHFGQQVWLAASSQLLGMPGSAEPTLALQMGTVTVNH